MDSFPTHPKGQPPREAMTQEGHDTAIPRPGGPNLTGQAARQRGEQIRREKAQGLGEGGARMAPEEPPKPTPNQTPQTPQASDSDPREGGIEIADSPGATVSLPGSSWPQAITQMAPMVGLTVIAVVAMLADVAEFKEVALAAGSGLAGYAGARTR